MQLQQLNCNQMEVLQNEDISSVLFLQAVFEDNKEYEPKYPFLLDNLNNKLQ
jgi:hypothetical protein